MKYILLERIFNVVEFHKGKCNNIEGRTNSLQTKFVDEGNRVDDREKQYKKTFFILGQSVCSWYSRFESARILDDSVKKDGSTLAYSQQSKLQSKFSSTFPFLSISLVEIFHFSSLSLSLFCTNVTYFVMQGSEFFFFFSCKRKKFLYFSKLL